MGPVVDAVASSTSRGMGNVRIAHETVRVGSAELLTAKMDALADALRAAGVAPERMTRILGSAAEAAMHALVLDAVLDEQLADAAAVTDGEPRVASDAKPVRLAA